MVYGVVYTQKCVPWYAVFPNAASHTKTTNNQEVTKNDFFYNKSKVTQ
jgi:hypothetical protein